MNERNRRNERRSAAVERRAVTAERIENAANGKVKLTKRNVANGSEESAVMVKNGRKPQTQTSAQTVR